jgi:hypothetical protein
MRSGEIKQPFSGRTAVTSSQATSAPNVSESRALVALAPASPAPEAPARHLSPAPFVTQLLAVRDHLPQARARRRATPQEAMAAYRAAAGLTGR